MRLFELSPRLRSVADLVPQGALFADVGTDHAYLPVWLILQGKIHRAIAADLREGPLDRARMTAESHGVADKIALRLCDGLSGIGQEEVDTVAIAGMGGETIAEILSAAPWTKTGNRRLILQPMTAHAELRAWLNGHGFCIAEETLTSENKTLYATFLVLPGQDSPLTASEIWAGRQCTGRKDPLRGQYLDKLIYRAERALEGLRRSSKTEDIPRMRELENICSGLKQMKEEWDTWQR